MIDHVPAGYLRVDRNGVIVAANLEAARILGYPDPGALTGESFTELTTLAERVFLQTYVFPQLATGPREELRLSLRRRSRDLVPVLAAARSAGDGSFELGFLTIAQRTVAESDVAHARSGEARAQGKLDAMEAELALAGRLASIGELAAALAHEINNPLAYVCANVDLLATDATPPEERARVLADVQLGLDRIRDIVASLKKMSRVEAVANRPVDCVRAVEDALKITGNALRHRAKVDVRCEPGVIALAEEGRLVQVLINLLINAVQALSEDRVAENRVEISARAADGSVEIVVADNGPGIPPELKQRIFEPFFTTKPFGEGTGLGLSVCHGVVTGFGGTIRVESEPGHGARFVVKLPAAERPETTPQPERKPAAAPKQEKLKILLIDDENAVVRVLRRVFRDHDVEWFPRSVEAWERYEKDGFAGIDVVLCDLMMPEMSGMDLFQRIVERTPALRSRFLFLTGGAFSESARAFLDSADRRWLAKPFEIAQLRSTVEEIARASSLPQATPP